jgi:hypothetical protein
MAPQLNISSGACKLLRNGQGAADLRGKEDQDRLEGLPRRDPQAAEEMGSQGKELGEQWAVITRPFQHFGRKRFVLQQDWAPSHGSFRKTRKCPNPTLPYLQKNFRKFWWRDTWPSNSPDLNPLDYAMWSILDKKKSKRIYRSEKELKRALQKIWKEIPLELCEKIVNNFPKRLQACIDAKGGHFEHLMKKERISPEPDEEHAGAEVGTLGDEATADEVEEEENGWGTLG